MSTETLTDYREIVNPGTGEVVGRVPSSTPEDADRAVRAAHDAFASWRRLGYADRGKLIHACAEAFEAHVDELAPILVAEQGKTTREAKIELHKAADTLEHYAGLSRQVRVQARYDRSLSVLAHARRRGAVVKTGLMLGLGETHDEILDVVRQIAALGVDILTLGQYLAPSRRHLSVARFLHPDEFVALKAGALAAGIRHVESGPLVRSSYHADGQAELVRALTEAQRRPASE